MKRFPYMTDYVNHEFEREKLRWDYRFLRPPLLVLYFFVRGVIFPFKFLFHRKAWGFESYIIDAVLAFGIKYVATKDAVALLIRHVQIEPVLYRHLLFGQGGSEEAPRNLNGIDGLYDVDSLRQIVKNNMTIGHDELSYELVDRFDKDTFLQNLEQIRGERPFDIARFSKKAIEINEKHSLQLIGATTVVMFIVFTITVFADLKTSMQALNSFGSDSIALWALKHLYQNDPKVLTDLDFYLQVYNNRSHYNNSAFFSDPSQYLYYHIVFDEFAYDCLRMRPPTLK